MQNATGNMKQTARPAATHAALGLAWSRRNRSTGRPLLVYSLHGGKLYGTERMALETMSELSGEFDCVLIAPSGPVHDEALRLGITSFIAHSRISVARRLMSALADERGLVFFSTRVSDSLAFEVLRRCLGPGKCVKHFHIVHGGSNDMDSYARKRILAKFPVVFVAVSAFVKKKLRQYRVPSESIHVVNNFLSRKYADIAAGRVELRKEVRRFILVSRLDPMKRVELLFDALDRFPELSRFEFRIYGSGSELELLKSRSRHHKNAELMGFTPDISSKMPWADCLLHLNPTEPFGLVILEAMACGIPVIVPDCGGAREIVDGGVSGEMFRPEDVDDLALVIQRLGGMSVACREKIVEQAKANLRTEFSQEKGAETYRKLIKEHDVT